MIQIPPAGRARQRGFTLIEVMVSLIVTVIVLLGVLALFDFSNKLARVQTNISDMQQSLRVAQTDAVRLIRMAGRGGLPLGTLPAGWAVAVSDNVAAGSHIGDGTTPEVVPGSDVLTIRGVLTSSIYQVNTADPASFKFDNPAAPTSGKIHIRSTTPTAIPQDLTALKEAVQKSRPEALILVSPQDAGVWAVVKLEPSSIITDPNDYEIHFTITPDYLKFSSAGAGIFPTTLKSAAYVGIVEEYRFYVRRAFAITGDDNSDLTPKLSRARVYPGTDTPWNGDIENWQADIADNIFDLQIALGLDAPAKDPAAAGCTGGTIASDEINCGIYEAADGENDDWMYNGEKVTDPLSFANSDLHYVRLTTLARTDRRDKDYAAPTLVRVENNKYDTPDTSVFNSDTERMYRRRILRTVIDMRNLG